MKLFNIYNNIKKFKSKKERKLNLPVDMKYKKCKALLIGINYIGKGGELNGCINDVENVRKMLVKLNPDIELNILTEERAKKPTKRNIIQGFRWLTANNHKYDKIFLHYSGHGASVKDRNGDEDDNCDETLVPLDYQKNGLIRDDDIHRLLVKKIKTDFFAIMDCCHSATNLDMKFRYECSPIFKRGLNKYCYKNYNTNYKMFKSKSSFKTNKNIIMISGCMDKQTSADAYIKNIYQGALTYNFLETLKNNNYDMTYSQLMKELHLRLKFKGFTQKPQLSSVRELNIGRKFKLF